MREIIHVQVGQCGNQIGTAFWEVVLQEHAIDLEGYFTGSGEVQMQRLDVHFNEASCKFFAH